MKKFILTLIVLAISMMTASGESLFYPRDSYSHRTYINGSVSYYDNGGHYRYHRHHYHHREYRNSNDGIDFVIGAVVGAVVTAIVTDSSRETRMIRKGANFKVFFQNNTFMYVRGVESPGKNCSKVFTMDRRFKKVCDIGYVEDLIPSHRDL